MRLSTQHYFDSLRRQGEPVPERFELHIREVSNCRIDNIAEDIIAGIITCQFSDAPVRTWFRDESGDLVENIYMQMEQGTFRLADGHWAPNIPPTEPASTENE